MTLLTKPQETSFGKEIPTLEFTMPKKLGGLGVQKAREANISMLGKLVWEVHNYPDKLWIHVLRQKYVKDDEFLDLPKKPGFVVWNEIMKAKGILREGFEFRLGNGSSSFWYTK